MKTIIVRIAEGLGNQLFMYANAYAFSKKKNYNLKVDNKSGYFKISNQVRKYELNNFNIYADLCDEKYRFDNYISNIKRKILKKIDNYKSKKSFLLEDSKNKLISYKDYTNKNYSNLLFLEGHFESEKYFQEYSKDIKNQFIIKKNNIEIDNKYLNDIKNSNSVSICIRQHRFSERGSIDKEKSNKFTFDTINYVKKSVEYFKKNIPNSKFFIWSNDFSNLNNYFNTNEYTFIENSINKSINDFNLFKYCKHFIVGPTSFHWWGAWLNENKNKICLRPSNINPSNNKDFWPEKWIKI